MALIPNKDFSCTPSACKPLTNAAKVLFQRLQTELNRFAGSKGFAPLTPDGIIGEKTAQAALKVMPDAFSLLVPTLPFVGSQIESVRVKQVVAQLAVDPDKFYNAAKQRAAGLPAAIQPPSSGGSGSGGGSGASPTMPAMPAVAPEPYESPGTPLWYWAAGGAGLLAIGVGTYYLLKD